MALQKREKLLVIATGSLLVVFLLATLLSGGGDSASTLRARHQSLLGEFKEKEDAIRFGQPIVDQMEVWQKRSLPSNRKSARTAYQNWLRGLVDKASFRDVKVDSSGGQSHGGIYTMLTFTVHGDATMEQLTRFLFDFYSVDHLHKIRHLSIKPIKESQHLTLAITVEALSLPEADTPPEPAASPEADALPEADTPPESDTPPEPDTPPDSDTPPKVDTPSEPDTPPETVMLPEEPSEWLESAELDLEGYIKAIVKRRLDADQEPVDGGLFVAYRPAPPANKPPPATPDPPKPPEFDPTTQTFLNAVVEVDGRSQAWLFIRSSNETLKYYEGDEFEIGPIRGTVARIDARQVELEVRGRSVLLTLGDNLNERLPDDLPEEEADDPDASEGVSDDLPEGDIPETDLPEAEMSDDELDKMIEEMAEEETEEPTEEPTDDAPDSEPEGEPTENSVEQREAQIRKVFE